MIGTFVREAMTDSLEPGLDQEETQWPGRDHALGEDPGPEIVIIDPVIDQDRDPEEDQNQEIAEVEEIDTDLVQDQGIAKRALVIDPDQKNRGRNVRGPEVERKKEAGEAEARKKKGQKIKALKMG